MSLPDARAEKSTTCRITHFIVAVRQTGNLPLPSKAGETPAYRSGGRRLSHSPTADLISVTNGALRRRDTQSTRRAVHAVQTLWIQRQRTLVGGEGGGGVLLFHQQISQQLVCGNSWGGGDG